MTSSTSLIIIGSVVFSLVLTVVIIVVVMKFVRGAMGDQKVLQSGVPGSALVMSLEPTGMVVNEMYYQCGIGLRVQLPGKVPYDVLIKQLVPITAMARVNPGASVGVKVDPADDTKVVIDWQAPVAMAGAMPGAVVADPNAGDIAAAVAASAQAGSMAQSGIQMGSAKELLGRGQRVLGVLTEFADTGNTSRSLGIAPSQPEFLDDPLFAVTLQLHIPNVAPVEAKVVHRVPRAMLTSLQLGLQLNCAVDPANPTRSVAIDWGDINP